MKIRCSHCSQPTEVDSEKLEYFAHYILRVAEWSAKAIEAMDQDELEKMAAWLVGARNIVGETRQGKQLWDRVAARLDQFPPAGGKVTGDGSA